MDKDIKSENSDSELELQRIKIESDKEYDRISGVKLDGTRMKNTVFSMIILILIILILKSWLSTDKVIKEREADTITVNVDDVLDDNIDILPDTEAYIEGN